MIEETPETAGNEDTQKTRNLENRAVLSKNKLTFI